MQVAPSIVAAASSMTSAPDVMICIHKAAPTCLCKSACMHAPQLRARNMNAFLQHASRPGCTGPPAYLRMRQDRRNGY
eukprot:365009-Chlamydomonas_euryale.AAC.9